MGGVLWGALNRSSSPEWFRCDVVAWPTFCHDSCLLSFHDIRYVVLNIQVYEEVPLSKIRKLERKLNKKCFIF